MQNALLLQIIDRCHELEKAALRTYHALEQSAPDPESAALWKEMGRQESTHIRYWKRLRDLAEEEQIQNIFDDPESTLHELQDLQIRVDSVIRQKDNLKDKGVAFLAAYRLEFYLLHPAFMTIFHFMDKSDDELSPLNDYNAHMDTLIDGIDRLSEGRPEYLLAADALRRLLKSHRDMAAQLSRIRELRQLVPICMHCKKIRSDDGFWDRVEYYMQDHIHAQFSHGICPECMKNLYPDLADPEEESA